MKKGLKVVAATALLGSLFLTACNNQNDPSTSNAPDTAERDTYYLVSFYVDNELYKTARIKEGEAVGTTLIQDPTKPGYDFKGWTTSDSKAFDLATEKITAKTDLYAKFELKETPIPTPDPVDDELNVDDTKDATKNYYLVVGWWFNDKSGLTDEITKHFYSNVKIFLKAKGATDSQLKLISFRKFSQATVAEMGAAMNEQADLDIVIGVGNNINSTAGVSIQEKEGNVPMGGQSRYIARLTDKEIVNALFDFMKTDNGKKMFDTNYTLTAADITPSTPDPEPDPEPAGDLNVDDTKDENKQYYLVVGWWCTSKSGLTDESTKHFYSNLNILLTNKGATAEQLKLVSFRKFTEAKVADMGASMKAQGDLDIVIGVGGNIDTSSGLDVKEKEGNVTMGGLSRTIARLTDKELAVTVFDFMKTENGKKMFDTTYTLTDADIA